MCAGNMSGVDYHMKLLYCEHLLLFKVKVASDVSWSEWMLHFLSQSASLQISIERCLSV